MDCRAAMLSHQSGPPGAPIWAIGHCPVIENRVASVRQKDSARAHQLRRGAKDRWASTVGKIPAEASRSSVKPPPEASGPRHRRSKQAGQFGLAQSQIREQRVV